jgi:hypothetical protein
MRAAGMCGDCVKAAKEIQVDIDDQLTTMKPYVSLNSISFQPILHSPPRHPKPNPCFRQRHFDVTAAISLLRHASSPSRNLQHIELACSKVAILLQSSN